MNKKQIIEAVKKLTPEERAEIAKTITEASARDQDLISSGNGPGNEKWSESHWDDAKAQYEEKKSEEESEDDKKTITTKKVK